MAVSLGECEVFDVAIAVARAGWDERGVIRRFIQSLRNGHRSQANRYLARPSAWECRRESPGWMVLIASDKETPAGGGGPPGRSSG
jgi:hypothetical protein